MIMRDETRDRTRGIEMKISTLLLVGTAFLLAMVALALSASAECASCAKEGDWSQSASAFLEGKTHKRGAHRVRAQGREKDRVPVREAGR